MQTRSLLAALAVTTLLFGASAAVDAAPAKKGDQAGAAAHAGHGGPAAQEAVLAPEKQALFRTIMDESEARLVPLQEQMFAKRLELKALAQNPNTPRETITALSQEMATLKTQIRNEMKSRNDRIEKEVGLVRPGHGAKMGGKMAHGDKMDHGGMKAGCASCEMPCK